MADGVRLRIMTYNVRSRRDDVPSLVTVVRDLAPDVAIIQEGPRRLRWRQQCVNLARRTGMYFAAGGLPALGNLVLTNMRVGVRDIADLRFPLTPGRHLRGAALVTCSAARTRFVVAGTHLSVDATERVAQATMLKERLGTMGAPMIVAGDFNENSGGAAWRTLSDGLADAALPGDMAHLGTYPSADPGERIDAVFVDPRCVILGYQVVDSELARAASDHLPVVVDLVLPR
ncbi:MAG: endonuclease [Dactylosporangium sp.]|nr:endonuclease [Dactylosporangium sp.]